MKKTIFTILIATTIFISISKWSYDGNFQVLNNTNTQQQNSSELLNISTYIYNISVQQIQIWKNNNINNNSLSNSEILDILGKLKYYTEIDIVMLLDIAKDQKETLQNYLSESNNIIEKSDYFIGTLEYKIKNNISEFEKCSKEKSLADKNYFQAVEKQNSNEMSIAIDESKSADLCISTNRIDANSKQALLNKLSILRETLQSKYDFLYQKQSLILNNFQVIKENVAQELSQITNILNQYQISQ